MAANANRFRVVFFLTLTVAACGGSGGGGSLGGGNNPPPDSGWQSGVFLPEENFDAECANPRSGIDPATGQPYPDVQGTTLDENNFLRSWSNRTYLWYDEITDQDPGNFNDPLDYFAVLRTNAITASGAPKDKFHFTYDSEEWFQLSQGGVSAGYGAEWAVLSATPPSRTRPPRTTTSCAAPRCSRSTASTSTRTPRPASTH